MADVVTFAPSRWKRSRHVTDTCRAVKGIDLHYKLHYILMLGAANSMKNLIIHIT